MYNENVTIWSNPKYNTKDDYFTIKKQLAKEGKLVVISSFKLLKDLEDVKVYNVSYDYEDDNCKKQDAVKLSKA